MTLEQLFYKATGGQHPFLFQRRFAAEVTLPSLVRVPTGLGKTAMAVLIWLWRFERLSVRRRLPRTRRAWRARGRARRGSADSRCGDGWLRASAWACFRPSESLGKMGQVAGRMSLEDAEVAGAAG